MPVECCENVATENIPPASALALSASAHSALSTLSSEPSRHPPPLHSRTTGASSHFPPLPQLMTSSHIHTASPGLTDSPPVSSA